MPQVSKQVARPATNSKQSTTKKQSVLDRIAPVSSRAETGVKLNVYGRGKTGKTRLACTFPKPLLLIGTEDGTKSVATVKGVDFVRLQLSREVDTIVSMLAEGKYKTACIDTAGGLQDLILKEILGLDDIPIQRSWGIASRDQWMACGAQWKERMRGLLDLSERIGLNVVVIAHERNFNEDSASSDVMIPSIGAALTPSAAAWLNGACDYICQTYIREQTVEKEGTIGGKATKVQVTTGKKEYCLRVGPHPMFMVGFRMPPGGYLPDSITDPSYEKITKIISGKWEDPASVKE